MDICQKKLKYCIFCWDYFFLFKFLILYYSLNLGAKCLCRPGYKLSQDGKSCEDINECTQYGICDQECTNTEVKKQIFIVEKNLQKAHTILHMITNTFLDI